MLPTALLIFTAHSTAQTSRPTLTTLYSFTGGSDGREPDELFLGDDGVFYGTALYGGMPGCLETLGCGTVFALKPPATPGGSWTLNVLHTFTGGSDGGNPAGLFLSKNGSLHGTTGVGGTLNYGVLYKLTPPAVAGSQWTETVLYNRDAGQLGLSVMGEDVVWHGYDGGSVVKLTPPATPGGHWTLIVIFAGAAEDYPSSLIGRDSTLYGSTYYGGTGKCLYPPGCGVVFQLTPPRAAGGTWTESVLYNFHVNAPRDAPSGVEPNAVIFGRGGCSTGHAVRWLLSTVHFWLRRRVPVDAAGRAVR